MSSYTGTREWRFSRSRPRISAAGVTISTQNMSGRGTMTSRTRVSSSSNTPWIISRSVRSTTPSRVPTSTSVRSSSSVTSGWPAGRSDPTTRRVSAVSQPSATRTGVNSSESQLTGRVTSLANVSGCSTARVMGRTSPNTESRNTTVGMARAMPIAPNMRSAMAAARAEAPMFTTVMPTRSVTSSSCGRLEERRGARPALALLLRELLEAGAAQGEVRGLRAGEERRAEDERAEDAQLEHEEVTHRSARSPGAGAPARHRGRSSAMSGVPASISPTTVSGVPVAPARARARASAAPAGQVSRSS